jgi:hypothetical protein
MRLSDSARGSSIVFLGDLSSPLQSRGAFVLGKGNLTAQDQGMNALQRAYPHPLPLHFSSWHCCDILQQQIENEQS